MLFLHKDDIVLQFTLKTNSSVQFQQFINTVQNNQWVQYSTLGLHDITVYIRIILLISTVIQFIMLLF